MEGYLPFTFFSFFEAAMYFADVRKNLKFISAIRRQRTNILQTHCDRAQVSSVLINRISKFILFLMATEKGPSSKLVLDIEEPIYY